MNRILLSLMVSMIGAILVPDTRADQVRTDLSREIFVEMSETDFALSMTNTVSDDGHIRTFHLSAPLEGESTVVCFVDGNFWATEAIALPGAYRLNTRGLTPGQHRITIQAVDVAKRIGRATVTIEAGK